MNTQPAKKARGRPATGKTPQHQFRCPDEEWAQFERAAALEDITVAAWLRKVALQASKKVLKAHGEGNS